MKRPAQVQEPVQWGSVHRESWLKRHGWAWKVALGIIVAVAVGMIANAVLGSQYGTKLTFTWGDLYYTDQVENAAAEKFGAYMQYATAEGSASLDLRLDKSGNTYEISIIPKDEYKTDTTLLDTMGAMGEEVAVAVFPDASVKILLCDEQFDPYRTLGPFSVPQ